MSDQNGEGQWAYSRNGREFYGGFDVRDEAIKEARAVIGERFYIGVLHEPIKPELILNAADIIRNLVDENLDEYGEGWGDGIPGASEDQIRELDDEFSRVFAAWLDRHGLRPKWFVVPDPELIEPEAVAQEGGRS